jgi:hypothetical protein
MSFAKESKAIVDACPLTHNVVEAIGCDHLGGLVLVSELDGYVQVTGIASIGRALKGSLDFVTGGDN